MAVLMLEIRLDSVRQYGDSRHAYDVLYSDQNISQLESFYIWAAGLFDLPPGAKFLDVACGKGELAYWVRREGAVGFGSDLSASAIQQGHELFPNLPLAVANGQNLPYSDNAFYAIGSMGSLEHYEDMAAGIQEMVRVVKPYGWVYILVPNIYSLLTNVLAAYRTGRTCLDNQPIQRYAARLEWQDLLQDNGLIVRHTIKYERVWPRTWADGKWYLQHPKELIRLFLQFAIPLDLSFSFVFFCQKAEGSK
ncbi:MAG: class I SAM-dependent methyltransferase [Nitrospiria bacterium]